MGYLYPNLAEASPFSEEAKNEFFNLCLHEEDVSLLPLEDGYEYMLMLTIVSVQQY